MPPTDQQAQATRDAELPPEHRANIKSDEERDEADKAGHSPTPWAIEPKEHPSHPLFVMCAGLDRVARCDGISIFTSPQQCKDNARRIVASVNTLADLTIEAIEAITPADVENLLKNKVREDRKRLREEAMISLFNSVVVSGELLTKADVELADLLLVWWAEMPLTSPQSDLMEEVIERLKRAGGGARPDDEDAALEVKVSPAVSSTNTQQL